MLFVHLFCANSVFFGWPRNKSMQKKMPLENNTFGKIRTHTHAYTHIHTYITHTMEKKNGNLYAWATILDNSFVRKEILFMCICICRPFTRPKHFLPLLLHLPFNSINFRLCVCVCRQSNANQRHKWKHLFLSEGRRMMLLAYNLILLT